MGQVTVDQTGLTPSILGTRTLASIAVHLGYSTFVSVSLRWLLLLWVFDEALPRN